MAYNTVLHCGMFSQSVSQSGGLALSTCAYRHTLTYAVPQKNKVRHVRITQRIWRFHCDLTFEDCISSVRARDSPRDCMGAVDSPPSHFVRRNALCLNAQCLFTISANIGMCPKICETP